MLAEPLSLHPEPFTAPAGRYGTIGLVITPAGAGPLIPDNHNWRRHRNACIYYRERWTAEEEMGDDGCVLLYQIICLHNTPPLNEDEQAKCMKPRTSCWRNPAIKCTKAAAEEYAREAQAAAS